MDAGNLLKPMLARGELHCIGATTLDEYRKHVEKDAGARTPFPAGAGRSANSRRYDLDSAGLEGTLRSSPRRHASRTCCSLWPRPCCRIAIFPTGFCPTRPSTWSTKRGPCSAPRLTRCRANSTRSPVASCILTIEEADAEERKGQGVRKERLTELESELADLKAAGMPCAPNGKTSAPASEGSGPARRDRTPQTRRRTRPNVTTISIAPPS